MNQKNSLGIDLCFKDLDNPIDLFVYWFSEAKKTEINDPNALALATGGKNEIPSVRMVLLKDFSEQGFVFYTNLNSRKSNEIKSIEEYKLKYSDKKNVLRPDYWSGWNLNPTEIEFWLDGKDRIHERLRYTRKHNNRWEKDLLSP